MAPEPHHPDLSAAPPVAATHALSLPGGSFRWGRLRVIEALGGSPAATRYRARDLLLKREVLLILRPPASPQTQKQEHRLIVEAKRLVKIQHTALLPVLGAGMERQCAGYWKAPETGPTLEERIRQHGVLPAAEWLSLAVALSGGLMALHDQLLVHGRVHPRNVCSAADAAWTLRDPVADDWQVPPGAGRSQSDDGPFCAPEQRNREGSGDEERADLYALGATLLYAATGSSPTAIGVWSALAERRDLPPAVPRLLRRLLAADPLERPPASAVLDQLHRATAAAAAAAGGANRWRYGRWLLAALALGGWACAALLYSSG